MTVYNKRNIIKYPSCLIIPEKKRNQSQRLNGTLSQEFPYHCLSHPDV
uniref:Uncharacterized protein n=1 Tax=Anguilla anguilla TaxID=7936 RepID=A0A0E9QXA8_ANGAN